MKKYEKADFIVLSFGGDVITMSIEMEGKDGIINGENSDKWL